MIMDPEQKESTSLQEKGISDTSLFLKQFRGAIAEYEGNLAEIDGAVSAGDNREMFDACYPLDHVFVDGAYIRTITIPADIIMTSKIHKITHPYFIMKGEVDVLTEHGMQRISAPYQGITKAGTKRVLRTYSEVTWVTVHVTDETDLNKIEKQIIAESYDDLEGDDQRD